MSSNDNNKAIHTAASVRCTRRGVTPPVCTATGAETLLNNPNCPSTRASKNLMVHVDATTAKVTTTTRSKKATPTLEHPATVDGAKDKDTLTLMQLKCPPEVKMQQNSTTEVTQTLSQLKDPPVFETWQHATPDAALTFLQLKEAPEIDTLQHATTSSITSQLKDDDDHNSCVEWAVAAASAGCNAEYDLYIDGNFEPLVVDGLKKLQQRLPMMMCTRTMSYSRMILQRTMQRRTWSTIVLTVQGNGGILFQVVNHQVLTLLE